jgi:hypothetical protein
MGRRGGRRGSPPTEMASSSDAASRLAVSDGRLSLIVLVRRELRVYAGALTVRVM